MFNMQKVRLLVITCTALFMAMLDNLVLGVALPSIQQSFHASITDLQWFMNAYILTFSIFLIPFSMLGERFGRKKMFLIGIVLFTVGSALCGLSQSSIQLIWSRVLQGIGGAAIVPLSLTLVNSAFPVNKRAAALGIWSGVSGLGLSVGPLVGGLIIEGAPWQFIFWVNVPIGVLTLIGGLMWLKEAKGERKPIHLPGVLLLATGLFGTIYGLQQGNSQGWTSWQVIFSIVGGVLLLSSFYLWERKRKEPYIRFKLFRSGKYTAYILAGFWMNAGIFGAIFLLTLFLQQAQGYTALEAGVRTMVWTGCTMIAAPLAGLAVARYGNRLILSIGLALQAVALIGFATLIYIVGVEVPFIAIAPFMMCAGTGMGLSFTPLAHGVLSSVPEASSGEASGISNATRELGGVFGIAICGLVFQSGAAIITPEDFGTHIIPALWSSVAMISLGLASAALFAREFKKRKKAATLAST